MKHYFVLVACATFFGAIINAFGIDHAEKFEFTKKSAPHTPQININEMNARGKLEAAFEQASWILTEELKENGIETGFMEGQNEPSLEVVKQNMPERFDPTTQQNQNLVQLTYHFWQLKELFDSCRAVLKQCNFISFDPIEKKMEGAVEDRADRLLQYLFPDFQSDKLHVLVKISAGPYLQLDGNIMLIDNYRDCEALRVNGPLHISISGNNQYVMYWAHVNYQILKSHNFENQFLEYALAFTRAAYENSFSTRYLDEKNTSKNTSNKCFLNSIYIHYQKAKSHRIHAFDPLTKCIPHDIIRDEAKRQVKMAHLYLRTKYLQEKLKDKTQKPIFDIQPLLEYNKIEEGETSVGKEVKCIEYLPENLNDEMQKPKTVRQNDLKKDRAHKHKSTRKTKIEGTDHQKDKTALQDVDKKHYVHKHKGSRRTKSEKDDRQTDKTTLQVVDKKDHVHKHEDSRKPKTGINENNNLIIVPKAEVEKADTQNLNYAFSVLLESKRLEAEAEMYALKNNKTKSEIIESLTGFYTENYTQLEQLYLALANLGELYHSAIFQKMEENKKYLETIFSQEL